MLYAAFWAVLPLARDEDDDAAADSDAARGTDLTRLLALAALVFFALGSIVTLAIAPVLILESQRRSS